MFNEETLQFGASLTQAKKIVSNLEEENEKLKKEIDRLNSIIKGRPLVVEDGSVDIDKLEEDGFYVIVYRQGAKPPVFLEV